MAGKEIGINITAKDNASSTIQKVGKSLDKTGQSAKSVAEDIADGLGAAADQLSAELGKAKKAADALTHALGPEMAQKVDVHQQVIEFNRLGATFEDIEANADKLGASLSKLKGAELNTVDAGFKSVNATVHQTGNEIDRSRSVLANFAGNAAQDIPGINGSFGALNVAVGQFAEYASEGGIALSGLVSSLAPIAIGTVGIAALNKVLDGGKKAAQFEREEVDKLVKSIYNGVDAVQAFVDIDRERQKILTSHFGGSRDITHEVAAMGLSVERFNQIAGMSEKQIGEWAAAQRQAGSAGIGFNNVVAGLITRHREMADAIGESSDGAIAFGYAEDAVRSHMDAFVQMATAGVIPATEEMGAAAISTGDAVDTGLGAAFGRTAVKAGDMADETGILATALGDVETAWKSLTGTLDDKAAQRAIEESDARLAEMTKAATTGYVKTGKKYTTGKNKGKEIYRTVKRAPTAAEQRAIDAEGESNIRQRLAQAEKASKAELAAYGDQPKSLRNKTATANAMETTVRVRLQPYIDAGDEAEVKRRLEAIAQMRIIPFEATLNTTRLGPLAPDGGLDPTAVAEAIKKAKRDGLIPPGTTTP